MTFSMDDYTKKKSELETQKAGAEATFDGEKLGEIEESLLKLEEDKATFEKLSNMGIPKHQRDQIEKLGGDVVNVTKEVDGKIEEVKENTEEKAEEVVENKEELKNIDEQHFYYGLNTTKEEAPNWMKKLFELQSKTDFDINTEIKKITEELKPLLQEENNLNNQIFDTKMKTGFYDKIRDLERQQDDLGIELKKQDLDEYNYGLKFKELQDKINKLESDFKTQNPDIQKIEEKIKTLVNGPLNDLQAMKGVLDRRTHK